MNKSYKGKILISTPDISGDIFSRSVVLIIEHDKKGAFGMILNKSNPSMSLQVQNLLGREIEIYEGGPVEKERIFFIIKGIPITESFIPINKEYYLTEDMEAVIVAVVNNVLPIENFKVFAGYSGWESMQLDEEIRSKFWIPVEQYNMDYTLPNNQNLWKKIMQNLGGKNLIWANAPEDVSLN